MAPVSSWSVIVGSLAMPRNWRALSIVHNAMGRKARMVMYRPATEAARAQATSRVTWLLTRKNVSVAKRPQANRGMARRKAHCTLVSDTLSPSFGAKPSFYYSTKR